MSRHKEVLQKILSGRSDANISFNDLARTLSLLGFEARIKGGHHIYTRTGVEEILNLQSDKGKAKPYQVKQIRGVIVKYKLAN